MALRDDCRFVVSRRATARVRFWTWFAVQSVWQDTSHRRLAHTLLPADALCFPQFTSTSCLNRRPAGRASRMPSTSPLFDAMPVASPPNPMTDCELYPHVTSLAQALAHSVSFIPNSSRFILPMLAGAASFKVRWTSLYPFLPGLCRSRYV